MKLPAVCWEGRRIEAFPWRRVWTLEDLPPNGELVMVLLSQLFLWLFWLLFERLDLWLRLFRLWVVERFDCFEWDDWDLAWWVCWRALTPKSSSRGLLSIADSAYGFFSESTNFLYNAISSYLNYDKSFIVTLPLFSTIYSNTIGVFIVNPIKLNCGV